MVHLSHHAQNTTINVDIHVSAVKNPAGPSTNPLEKLMPWIAPQAMHDSYGRSDAPKCNPETRVAVQDEIHGWVVQSDSDPEPKKIKWITGPAGTGKTAIAGSLAERFDKEGLLAATFFFSSSSPYPGQRTKRAWIPTIAHQLAQRHEAFKYSLTRVIEENPLVFEKNLQVQMDEWILQPLRHSAAQSNVASRWRKVIIVDGLDECDVDQDPKSGAPTTDTLGYNQKKDDDQLEILRVLRHASSDPDFPFHVIIANRPERVFRTFFKPGDIPVDFATILTLDEKYEPDADIALFLEAKFNEIRREYNLPASWPPSGTIRTLVGNASGHFVYAATVVGFMMSPLEEGPQGLLDAILKIRPAGGADSGNPFAHLDALYAHILQSSPNPILVVKWIWVITQSTWFREKVPAYFFNQLLQNKIGESTHLFSPLHSLIKVPPHDDVESPYSFYHKSLFDFLGDPQRAGALWVHDSDSWDLYRSKYWNMCLQLDAYPDLFRRHFLALIPPFPATSNSQLIDKWVGLCISMNRNWYILLAFDFAHEDCLWYWRCHPSCNKWRSSIVRLTNRADWNASRGGWLLGFLTEGGRSGVPYGSGENFRFISRSL